MLATMNRKLLILFNGNELAPKVTTVSYRITPPIRCVATGIPISSMIICQSTLSHSERLT